MSTRRSWYTGIVLVPRTVLRTARTFRVHGLSPFVPLLFLLVAGSAILWILNTIAPLAPFIYSLF
jgi:hypothetical protein